MFEAISVCFFYVVHYIVYLSADPRSADPGTDRTESIATIDWNIQNFTAVSANETAKKMES